MYDRDNTTTEVLKLHRECMNRQQKDQIAMVLVLCLMFISMIGMFLGVQQAYIVFVLCFVYLLLE